MAQAVYRTAAAAEKNDDPFRGRSPANRQSDLLDVVNKLQLQLQTERRLRQKELLPWRHPLKIHAASCTKPAKPQKVVQPRVIRQSQHRADTTAINI